MLNNVVALLDSGVAASTNSYESIATLSGTGSSGSITFSSIPSTYKHLQIRAFMDSATSNDAPYIRLNGDTGANYAWHGLIGDGGTARAQGYANTSNISFASSWNGIQAGYPNAAVVDILDYANTSKYKTIRSLAGQDNNSTLGTIALYSGLWSNSNAISSLTIYLSGTANFTTTTKIALYGVKG